MTTECALPVIARLKIKAEFSVDTGFTAFPSTVSLTILPSSGCTETRVIWLSPVLFSTVKASLFRSLLTTTGFPSRNPSLSNSILSFVLSVIIENLLLSPSLGITEKSLLVSVRLPP